MADENEKNTNDDLAKEAKQRSDFSREIEISAKTGDAISERNEQRQETEDYLPQEGLFDKMTSDLVKGERPSYEEMQKQVRVDVEKQAKTQADKQGQKQGEKQTEEQTQDDQTQGGQKM